MPIMDYTDPIRTSIKFARYMSCAPQKPSSITMYWIVQEIWPPHYALTLCSL